LWIDSNHDGVSQASEMFSLSDFGVSAIDLNYTDAKKVDQYGNQFRYRSHIKNEQKSVQGLFAWDVFFVAQTADQSSGQADSIQQRQTGAFQMATNPSTTHNCYYP
jgi:hypothetical protein